MGAESVILQPPKSGSLSSPLGKICDRCSSIDLDAIFEREKTQGLSRDIHLEDTVNCNAVDLGTIDSWHPTCVFCSHLRSDYRVQQEAESQKRKYWHLSFPGISFVYRGLRLDHRGQEPMPNSNLGKPGPSDAFILPVEDVTDSKPGQAACIIPSKIDFGLTSSWLRECESKHRSECYASNSHQIYANRIIDCESRNLVPHNGEDYVALSYVWGKCAPPTPEEDSFVRDAMRLPSTVPQTIEDAMTVTKNLGKRYLWVDRYCVDQYHSYQKTSQIDAMGDIYEGAALTIVALVDDAHDAIPGVSNERTGQLLLDSTTARYTSTCQFMRDVVDQALYSQRAWTYQEFILSKRLIVFSQSQVFFTCGLSNFQEGISLPSRQGLSLRGDSSFSVRVSMMRDNRPTKGSMTVAFRERLEDLRESIIDYSQRSLTYSSDGLNAFRGILTRSGLRSFYGHPVHVIEEGVATTLTQVVGDRRGFSRSLLWPALINRYVEGAQYESVIQYLKDLKSNTTAVCEPGFSHGSSLPTWCWASSMRISMIWMWEKKDIRSPTFESRYCSFPKIHVINENMQEVTLTEAALRCEKQMIPETSPRLILKDAVMLKHLDIITLANLAQNYDLLDENPRTPGFETWKSPDMGLDPSARLEILEIVNSKADLHAVLMDASSTNPVSFYEGDKSRPSRYLSSYFEGQVQLKFLLVHQKGDDPCKRVGRLTCQLSKSDEHEDQILFSRERVELI